MRDGCSEACAAERLALQAIPASVCGTGEPAFGVATFSCSGYAMVSALTTQTPRVGPVCAMAEAAPATAWLPSGRGCLWLGAGACCGGCRAWAWALPAVCLAPGGCQVSGIAACVLCTTRELAPRAASLSIPRAFAAKQYGSAEWPVVGAAAAATATCSCANRSAPGAVRSMPGACTTPSTLRQGAIWSSLPTLSQRSASSLLCSSESNRFSLKPVGRVQDGWGHCSFGGGDAGDKAPRSSVQQVTQMSVLQLTHVR